MKLAELTKRIMAGEFIIVGEYRGSKAELGRVREEGGGVRTFGILKHRVELGAEALPVVEDTRDMKDFKPETYVAPFKKGQKVAVHVTRFGKDKAYNLEAAGRLELIED